MTRWLSSVLLQKSSLRDHKPEPASTPAPYQAQEGQNLEIQNFSVSHFHICMSLRLCLGHNQHCTWVCNCYRERIVEPIREGRKLHLC